MEPDANDGSVEDQPHNRLLGERTGVPGVPVALHPPPDPADDILADPFSKQCLERTANTARIGARQVGGRDQGIGNQRTALIGPQYSVVLPSAPTSRARGTAISVRPKLPVNDRERWPCR